MPLSVAFAAAAALRLVPGRTGTVARRALNAFPDPLLHLVLAGVLVFALCNIVVLQSWDWDNTKLFAFWYLGAGLLIGATAARLWQRGFFRRSAAISMVTLSVLTGVVVLMRLLPWTPPQDSVGACHRARREVLPRNYREPLCHRSGAGSPKVDRSAGQSAPPLLSEMIVRSGPTFSNTGGVW